MEVHFPISGRIKEAEADTLRQQLQHERQLTLQLLHLANSPSDLHGLMREATKTLQEWSGCTAVGIRLRDGDDFPYFETRGFPAEFVEMENSLCVRDLSGQIARDPSGNPVLECMCGNILCGRFNPELPFFTPGGSFWTNSTTQLLADTTEADRQARTRNRCNGEGYESVALIPLRADGATFGLLQLNDHRTDRFTAELIATLEALAAALAEAISRRRAVAELRSRTDELQRQTELLEAVQSSESLFISEGDPKAVFGGLLQILVRITKSEYGFLDEVVYREDRPVLKRSLAISDISWDESSRNLYRDLADANFVFPNLENLAGGPAVSGKVVIANDAPHDARSRGLPPGHPPLESFLGIPIRYAGQIVGVAGVANRPGGYDRELVEFLEPLTSACAAMIVALRAERKALESQEALRQSRAELRAVYDSSPIMMCVLDGQRRVLYMNRRMADFIGRSEDDLLGQRACGVIGCIGALEDPRGCGYGSHCEACSIRQALVDTLETGRGHRGIERRMTLASGAATRDVVLLAATELIPTKAGMHLLISLEDVTERVEAEQTVRVMAAMLDTAPCLIMIHDHDGRILYANRKASETHGYTHRDFMALTLKDLDDPESAALRDRRLRQIQEHGEASFEVAHFRKDGTAFPLQVVAKQVAWADEKAVMSVSTDITERKRTEEALRESEARVRAKLDALLSPEGDLQVLALADIVDIPAIQAMMDEFYRATGIGVGIIDLEGNVAVATGWQDVCTRFHRIHPETRKNCVESDTRLSLGVSPGEFRLYRCKNNMWDMATPIVVGDRHVGNLFLGQFLFDDEPIDEGGVRRQARQYGFDEEKYLAAHQRVPRWSHETVQSAMAFYARLAALISSLSYSNLKLARSLEQGKRAEQSLREAVLRQNAAVRAGNVGLWDWDLATNRVVYSAEWKAQIGYAEHEISDSFEEWRSRVHPDDLEPVLRKIRRFIADKTPNYEVEFRFRHKDGAYRWILAQASVIKNEAGQPVRTLGSHVDITERKLAEEAIQESELRYRSLFDNAIVAVALHEIVLDDQGSPVDYRFLQANAAFERQTGLKLSGILGKRVTEVLPATDAAEFISSYGRVVLTGEPTTFETFVPSLNQHFLISAYRVAPGRFATVFLDMTEQVRTVEALRDSEERFRRIVDTAQEGIWAMNADHRTSFVNPRMAAMLGYEPEEMLGQPVESFMYEEDLAAHAKRMEGRHDGQSGQYEHRFRRKDGSEIWNMVAATALTDETGRFAGSFGMFTDITGRKRLETQLRDREQLLSQAEEITGMGSFIWDIASDDFTSSAGMRRLVGLADTEFPSNLTEAIDRLVHPEDRERVFDEAKRVVREQVARPLEFRIVRADGEERVVFCSYALVIGDKSRLDHLVGTLHDITQRRADELRFNNLQIQLHHTSRLAVMGELAAGIAHEVNQPLCSIVNFAKACKNLTTRDPADFDQIRQWLDSIATASNRAGDIVHRLRGFARREVASRESVSTRQLIDDAVLLVRHEARSHHVAVQIQMPDHDLEVHVHPVRIQQVLVNLLRNAVEATSEANATTGMITVAMTRLADRVGISVADNGAGVPESELKRLFEPFYTTKSHGLGLGLAISRTIVEDHGGEIAAALNSQGGLTFLFTLPTGKTPVENE